MNDSSRYYLGVAEFLLHRMNTEREAGISKDLGEVARLSDQPVDRCALEVLEDGADDGPRSRKGDSVKILRHPARPGQAFLLKYTLSLFLTI